MNAVFRSSGRLLLQRYFPGSSLRCSTHFRAAVLPLPRSVCLAYSPLSRVQSTTLVRSQATLLANLSWSSVLCASMEEEMKIAGSGKGYSEDEDEKV